MLKLGIYIDGWRETITCILRKPGKARYNIPKSYHPIILLNTIGKLLTNIIAEEISYLAQKHQFLPATHFEGSWGAQPWICSTS